MKMPVRRLKLAGACADQVEKFRELFGDASIEVTEALCVEHAQVFDWNWGAKNLFPPAARAEYDRVMASARAEYNRVTAPAWAEFDRVTASARAEYNRVTASARAEYNRVTASAWAEFDRVTAPARAEYNRVTASAFGRIAETF